MSTLVGRPRVVAVDTHHPVELREGWELCGTAAGAAADPEALARLEPTWSRAIVPGTVAGAMRAAGSLDLDHMPNVESGDWWFRCRFAAEPNDAADTRVLRFDGLATLADVWLNGRHVLASENMFVSHEVDVAGTLAEQNTLTIRFRSVSSALATRRPRPRWRTKLVEHQQLRWIRTTLLGRMPGWSPPVRPVGPWRTVTLEHRRHITVVDGDAIPSLDAEGVATVRADLTVRPLDGTVVQGALLEIAGERFELDVAADGDRIRITGNGRPREVRSWWPHTHGEQPRYRTRVIVRTDRGDVCVDLGMLAFRRITVETADDQFTVHVNGVQVFCRGACWTTPDIVTLGATADRYGLLLTAARDAGMNMIRVGGTMVYETDAFYDCCDRLGILVWQDFMFANMDYPVDDPGFLDSVRQEATSTLARLRRHPSLAVLCGGSEVEQQAAMVGAPREAWGSRLFRDELPDLCARTAPNVPYWPASPGGGALPFHVQSGVSHYYGVGAYLRPLDDARRSNPRFASECLAFANVPDQAMIDALLPGGESPVHHPRWKARVPRDHGAGWDFEDVRDHYLEELFGVHAMRLRYADMPRYLAMSRVVTGEVMARTIGEWRRRGSSCAGALVWFFQDLWAGAGWGVVDASGRPKAAYYALKRAMHPVTVALTDEGLNGLYAHTTNDGATDLAGTLRVSLFRDGRTRVTSGSIPVAMAAHSTACVGVDEVFGRFHDVSYAYRFGAPGHDLVVAELLDGSGVALADAFHFPLGLPSTQQPTVGLTASAQRRRDGTVALTVRAEELAQSVEVDCSDGVPDDNYFHVAPGHERVVILYPRAGATVTEGTVQPLNAHAAVRFRVPETAGATV
jgi:beta-mannosidase